MDIKLSLKTPNRKPALWFISVDGGPVLITFMADPEKGLASCLPQSCRCRRARKPGLDRALVARTRWARRADRFTYSDRQRPSPVLNFIFTSSDENVPIDDAGLILADDEECPVLTLKRGLPLAGRCLEHFCEQLQLSGRHNARVGACLGSWA